MEALLKVEELTKKFGSRDKAFTAVDEVFMDLKPGEFLAVVGPSGSGKTTLLSMIGGIIHPTSGKVILEGQDITTAKAEELAKLRKEKIGLVFQYHNLVPYLTAVQNLLLVKEIKGKITKADRQNAEELLIELGLGNHLHKLPAQLSGGERQRVAVARAFMNEPSLILVDEPTASLDTEHGEQVVKLIANQIKKRNLIGIMVTHDLRMTKYVDRVIRIIDGKIRGTSYEQDRA